VILWSKSLRIASDLAWQSETARSLIRYSARAFRTRLLAFAVGPRDQRPNVGAFRRAAHVRRLGGIEQIEREAGAANIISFGSGTRTLTKQLFVKLVAAPIEDHHHEKPERPCASCRRSSRARLVAVVPGKLNRSAEMRTRSPKTKTAERCGRSVFLVPRRPRATSSTCAVARRLILTSDVACRSALRARARGCWVRSIERPCTRASEAHAGCSARCRAGRSDAIASSDDEPSYRSIDRTADDSIQLDDSNIYGGVTDGGVARYGLRAHKRGAAVEGDCRR
jgi:hypothetical protein